MDFNSNPAAYGGVTNTNYSPTNAFTYPVAAEDSYLADHYDISPTGFFDCDSYFPSVEDNILSPSDLNSYHPPTVSTIPTLTPGTTTRPSISHTTSPASPTFPFGQLEPTTNGFTFGPSVSPQADPDPDPDVDIDADPPGASTSSSSRLSLKRDLGDAKASSNTPMRLRKRGRPRNSDPDPASNSPPTSSSNRSRRLPHNQVERKYRENLNAEMERLRRAIPTFPQHSNMDPNAIGQPKPSKAMVLAGAIEYIQRIERERDELRAECERLRRLVG